MFVSALRASQKSKGNTHCHILVLDVYYVSQWQSDVHSKFQRSNGISARENFKNMRKIPDFPHFGQFFAHENFSVENHGILYPTPCLAMVAGRTQQISAF